MTVQEKITHRFKHTDMGVIPDDWDEATLGNVGRALIGLTYKPADTRRYGTLVLRSSNIQGGRLTFEDNVYVDSQVASGSLVRPGDLLICARNGSRELIGKSAWIDDRASGMAFGAFMAIFRSDSNDFIRFQFQCDTIKRQINEHLGATINQITNKSLLSFKVALPQSREEQRAIAAALSDADALIASLDALISKKSDLKQAAMQQLLTGKTRLPGFRGEWEVKRLGDVAEVVGGGTPKSSVPEYWDGDIPWCTPTDITGTSGKYLTQTARTISQAGLRTSAAALLPKGALLLCTRATLGEVKIAAAPICTNQGFKSLICNSDVNNEFLYYKLLTMKQALVEKSSGSTFLEISKKDVVALTLNVPPPDEQAAIAAVLSDMDADLTALEGKRDKARALKQGMMQELLTGRIRLV